MSTEQFDLEEIYDDQISPLMKQIIEICTKYKMPLVAMFQFATDDYCTTTIAFDRASERMLHLRWLAVCAETGLTGRSAEHYGKRQKDNRRATSRTT